MKQETMYVESCPRDNSDPEAVSGSSTKFLIITAKKRFFCCSNYVNVVNITTK